MMGYLDAQAGDGARTAFRRAEKKYKLYKHVSTTQRHNRMEPPAPDLSQVIDFNSIRDGDGVVKLENADFPVYALQSHSGFYFIPQAVPFEQQFHLIREALTVFPEPPNRTSHTAHYGPLFGLWDASQNRRLLSPTEAEDISAQLCSDSITAGRNSIEGDESVVKPRTLESSSDERNRDLFVRKWEFADAKAEERHEVAVSAASLLRKLRWATLGVQFDWSKRAYDVSIPYRRFPPQLSELAAKLASPAMDGGHFRAEAAIVNFFGPDDMLGGHIDDMEADWSKPIVSISLGCKAIFLLGGENREDPPVAMFLRSGDAVLMAGSARRCFHGVPRIFAGCKESEVPNFGCFVESDLKNGGIVEYIRQSRININIRQVF